MKAQIVYDKPCRIRFRCGSNAFTKELERSIHKLVMSNPWAIACEAHYENGGILIRYKEGHRAEAVELVESSEEATWHLSATISMTPRR